MPTFQQKPMNPAVKVEWLERAKATYRFHAEKKRENKKWGIRDTAKSLRRSLGSITEDLLIANWYKSHPTKIENFEFAIDALKWIRKKKDSQFEVDID